MSTKGRRQIAMADERAQEMWRSGASLKEIRAALGLPGTAQINTAAYFGALDPTPQPLGCPPFSGRAGETAEMRAYRRFPIDRHKPRGGNI